ncbi:MAG: ATP synthase subunit C [Parachlamydiales bacterium]
MNFGMIGPGVVLALGCIGSAVGCTIAGSASHGAMTHVEEGHGRLIGLSAMPASQAIYSFVLMVLMSGKIRASSLDPFVALGLALFAGLAEMISAIYQGKVAATAIQATAKRPAVFGKSAIAPTVVETFSLFVFVFTLMLI